MTASTRAAVAYVPALIAAILSALSVRTGFLSFLFLLPVGLMAYIYQGRTAWFCAFLAVLGNGILSVGMGFIFGLDSWVPSWDILYFSVMTAAFAWIAAPPAAGFAVFRPRGAYRLAAASLLGVLSLLPGILAAGKDGDFKTFLRSQAELLASMYTASSGADVVQQSLADQYITPERLSELLEAVALRGGAAASCLLLLAVSRQLALFVSGFSRRVREEGRRPKTALVFFHAPQGFIWILSCSLLGVLLGLQLKVPPLEIAAWNILVICAMLFLAQGGGTTLFLLARLPVPGPVKFLLNFLLILGLMSPGVNAVLLALMVLLGIVENWAPLRKSSTPGTTDPRMGV